MTKTHQSKSSTATAVMARTSAAQHVQTKMKVGSVGDKYEKEADAAAEKAIKKKKGLGEKSSLAKGISKLGGDFGKGKAKKAEKPEEKAQKKEEKPVGNNKDTEGKVQKKEEKKPVQKLEKEKAQKKRDKEEMQAKVQKKEEEKTQKKDEKAEEEEVQTKLQKQEEEKAQSKEGRKESVQKMEEEKAQKKEEQEEEEEVQTKLQKQEEEKAQSKEDKKEPVQKMEEEKAQKKEEQEEEEELQTKLQKTEEEKAQSKEDKQEPVQKMEEEKAQKKEEQEEEEVQAKLQKKEEENTQAKEKKGPVQKMEEEKAQSKEEEGEEEVQAKTDTRANVRDKGKYPVINDVEPQLIASKGQGEKMDDEVLADMEARFGADFSKVRIHTDGRAERMTQKMEAQAFTSGKDIYFNDGKYDPESGAGKTLLAHELTHVIQQGEAEAKTPENKISEANALKNEPQPQPTDKLAKEAQEEVDKEKKEKAEEPLEKQDKLKADPKAPPAKGEPKPGVTKLAPKGKKKKDKPKTEVGAFLKESSEAKVKRKISGLEKLAANETQKQDAGTKLEQSQKSVVPPAQEGQSKANSSQVDSVDQTEEPKPDEEKAKEDMKNAMAEAIPSSLEEADKFKEEGKGRVVGEEVRNSVTADTQTVQTTYQEIENTPEPEPEPTPEELPEMEVAPETPPIDMGDDVIGEVQPEHSDLSNFENETSSDMEAEEISEDQLEMVDSGPLAEAKEERKKQKEKVKTGPDEVKTLEKKEKAKVKSDMKKEEAQGKEKMKAERKAKLGNTQEKQKKTKKTIEEKRKEVTDNINGIYEETNKKVKAKLEDLEKRSLKAFDDGQAKATKTFENNVKRRLDAFKDDRYSGLLGWGRWLKDKLLGMEDLPQVKRIFDSEKENFISSIDKLIAKITEENKRVIKECQEMVAAAKKKIEDYVSKLGPELRDVGEQAQKDMNEKLDKLDEEVKKKGEELQKKLEEKREAAIKAIEEKIDKMKEEMSGLAGKLKALLLNALIKLLTWALNKVGGNGEQVMGKINKGKEAIGKIAKSPGKFLGNIGKAVKLGFTLFGQNIKKHMLNGLVEWLAGPLGDTGLQMPEKFDLKGVMSLGLQIMGLTWDRIREKVIKIGKVPEPVLAAAEKGLDIILQIKDKGLIVLWDMLKEKAEELKQQVIQGIAKFAAVQIVKAAVIKLLLMLNPAGALLQLALTIYDGVMWFIENIDRIIEFIKSIFNSIVEIAMGQIGKAGAFIEKALAKTVPILLSFIAKWLKLDGIGKAIKNIIKKVRKPIDKVVNKIIKFIAKKAKSLFKKLVKKGKAGVKKVKEGVKKLVDWWKEKKKFKNKNGDTHTLHFKGKGKSAKLMISSVTTEVDTYLENYPDKTDGNYKNAKSVYDAEHKKIFSPKTVGSKESQKRKSVLSSLGKLSAAFAKLDDGSVKAKDYPGTTAPEYSSDFPPKTNKIKYLVGKASGGTTPGKGPGTGTTGWEDVHKAGLTKVSKNNRDKWVQMHMVSEKLGGKGIESNLVPAPNSVNSGFFRSFETDVAKLAKEKTGKVKNVVWFEATASYYSSQPEYAKSIKGEAGLYLFGGRDNAGKAIWNKDKTRLKAEAKIPLPDLPKEGKVSLNLSAGADLRRVIPDKTFVSLIKVNRYYSSETDFETKLRSAMEEKDFRKSAITLKIKAVKDKMPDKIVLDNP